MSSPAAPSRSPTRTGPAPPDAGRAASANERRRDPRAERIRLNHAPKRTWPLSLLGVRRRRGSCTRWSPARARAHGSADDSVPLVEHDAPAFRDGARALLDEGDVALEVLHGHSRQPHPGEEDEAAQVKRGVLAVTGGVASRPDQSLLLVVPERVRRQADQAGGLGDTLGCRRGLDRGVVQQFVQRIDHRRGASSLGGEDALDQCSMAMLTAYGASERAYGWRHAGKSADSLTAAHFSTSSSASL